MSRLSVHIQGAGKVGRGLAAALRRAGARVSVRPARDGLPARIAAEVIVLAVRDRDLAPLATELASSGLVPRPAICVHVAGALGPEPLASLRAVCSGVAQMHPMISFASLSFAPTLLRGQVHVLGDEAAMAKARRLARLLGMTPRTFPALDLVLYHAAAGLVANGGAALAALGAELLGVAGVPPEEAPRMLGPLLRSVAESVEALGFPEALTGPVRRGDAPALEKQMALLTQKLPQLLPFYVASARAQLPLARRIGDAPAASFDAIARILDGVP